MNASKTFTTILLTGAMALASYAADFSTWGKKAAITFSGYTGAETLTNFPALVVLGTNSVSGFDYAELLEGGADLRFTDSSGLVELPYEIENWSPDGDSHVWVRVPELAGADTSIWAYWGMGVATAPDYSTIGGVWPAPFRGVWHLGEDAVNGQTSTIHEDSTTNRLGATQRQNNIDVGVVGNGQFLDGANDWIAVTNHPALDMGPVFTWSGWLRFNGTSVGWNRPISRKSSYSASSGWELQLHNGSTTRIDAHGSSASEPYAADFVPSWTSKDWYYATVVFSNATFRAFRDGEEKTVSGTLTAVADNDNPLVFGNNAAFSETKWNGWMDEFRIRTGVPSTDWIKAEYQNMAQNAAFQTYGVAESAATDKPGVIALPATNVLVSSAWLCGNLVSTGASATAVAAYWGTSDGDTNASNWAHSATLAAPRPEGEFSLLVENLLPGTNYFFRLAASNDAAVVFSGAQSFTTLPGEPQIANGAATDVLDTSATLAGTLTYAGLPPTTVTAFWATNDCGADAAAWLANGASEFLGQPDVDVETTASPTGLTPNTVYYYNFMASNEVGVSWGAWQASPSFRTPGAPGLSDVGADLVMDVSARLNATLATGGDTRVYFTWGLAPDALVSTNDLGVVPMGAHSTGLSGLSPLTTYHYQAHVANAYGEAHSEVLSFTTTDAVIAWSSVSGGAWSDPATWGLPVVPREGATVIVNAGHNVTLDASTPALACVTNNGMISFDGWDTLLTAGAVVVNGTLTHTNNTDATEADGWTPNARVNIACVDFTLAAGATVNGVGKGFSGAKKGDNAGYGPGRGLTYGLAASYGGRGGWPMGSLTAPQSGPLYGVADEPEMPGSGGGRGDSDTLGGSGGGAMRIDAIGVVTIDGTVSMDGTYGTGNHQTGGSGGAIWITCARLAGSGVLSARGGRGQMAAGGGGGGRIAVDYDPAAQAAAALPQVKCTAAGGSIGWDYELSPNISAGKPGTLWFPDHQFLLRPGAGDRFRYSGQWVVAPELTSYTYAGDFFMDDGGLVFHAPGFAFHVSGSLVASGSSPAANFISLTNGTLTCGGTFAATNMIVEMKNGTLSTGGDVILSGSRVYLRTDGAACPTFESGGGLTLAAATQFRIWSGATNAVSPDFGAWVEATGAMTLTGNSWVHPYSDVINGGSAWFHVGSLTVGAGSGFNAAEKGYRGGDKVGHPYGWGPGGGWYRPNWTGGTPGGGGGGHGGDGGANDGVQGLANGFAVAPFGPGSGGGRGDWDGSAGGGAIRIRSVGPVAMDGTLNVDGAKGVPNWGGPGSGGAIWVICQGFSGGSTALMTAKGGDGVNGNYSGGGGGRIAVWHQIAEGRESVAAELMQGVARHAVLSDSLDTYLGAVSVTNGHFTAAAVPPPQVGTVVFVEIPPPSGTMFILR